jgi:hypothetical protein
MNRIESTRMISMDGAKGEWSETYDKQGWKDDERRTSLWCTGYRSLSGLIVSFLDDMTQCTLAGSIMVKVETLIPIDYYRNEGCIWCCTEELFSNTLLITRQCLYNFGVVLRGCVTELFISIVLFVVTTVGEWSDVKDYIQNMYVISHHKSKEQRLNLSRS